MGVLQLLSRQMLSIKIDKNEKIAPKVNFASKNIVHVQDLPHSFLLARKFPALLPLLTMASTLSKAYESRVPSSAEQPYFWIRSNLKVLLWPAASR